MINFRPPTAFLLASITVACGRSEDAPRAPVVIDSSGIEVVYTPSTGREQVSVNRWNLESRPELIIHGGQPDDNYYLTSIAGVQILSDGAIVVANAGSDELLWFDVEGHFRRRTGGSGHGPGEFSGIYDLFRCAGDTLVVFEGNRLTILDPNGAFVRNVRTNGPLYLQGTTSGISRDCGAALVVSGVYRGPGPGEGIHQLPHTLYWASLDSSKRDTVHVFPGPDLYPSTIRGQLLSRRVPFGKTPLWATDGDVVSFTSAAEFEIMTFERGGRLKRISRWEAELQSVRGSPLDRFTDDYLEFRRRNPDAAVDMPRLNEIPMPSQMPTMKELVYDDTGRLWVRRYSGATGYRPRSQYEAQMWRILDKRGELIGEVSTPDNFWLRGYQRGLVVGITRDRDDVPSIHFYRLKA